MKIAKQDLDSALKVVSLALAKRGNGIDSHYVFRIDEEGNAAVFAQNGQMLASFPLQCEVSEYPSAFTVEGWRIQKWLQVVDDGVLSFSLKDGIVHAKAKEGEVRWSSFDPASFPFWDQSLADAEEEASVSVEALRDVLLHVKDFIHSGDNAVPQFAVTEVFDTSLRASDMIAFAMADAPFLNGSKLRLHHQQVPAVISYLNALGSGDVAIRVNNGVRYFVGPDGSVLGTSIPVDGFPDATIDKNEQPHVKFVVRSKDLLKVLSILSTSAVPNNKKVFFGWDKDRERLEVSVESDAGSFDSLPIAAVSIDNPDKFPESGFGLSIPHLQIVLEKYPSEEVPFDVIRKNSPNGKMAGLVRFSWDQDDVDYLVAVVQWNY